MSHSFDRGRDTHLGQERGLKQFFRTRLVSTEQCGLEREIAVAEHRDLERADLMTVDAGSLHACKRRSHATLHCCLKATIGLASGLGASNVRPTPLSVE